MPVGSWIPILPTILTNWWQIFSGMGVVGGVLQPPKMWSFIRMTQNAGRRYCGYSFILKQTDCNEPNEETQDRMHWSHTQSFCIPSTLPSQLISVLFINQEALLSFGVQSLFHMWAWLIESLAMWLNSVPSPLSWLRSSAVKVSTLVKWLVFLVTSPHPERSCYHKQRYPHHWGNSKDYKLPPRSRDKRLFKFFIIQ